MPQTPIRFPSGKTVEQIKKDAKRRARRQQIPHHQALDELARINGVDLPWAEALLRLFGAPKADILFSIELDGLSTIYRLQKNGSWRRLEDGNYELLDSDYVTDNVEKVKEFHFPASLEADGKKWLIPRRFSVEENILVPFSQIFRSEFPPIPNKQQLQETIAGGDESCQNILVLNLDGIFELLPASTFDRQCLDPHIIVNHDYLPIRGAYVGPEAAANSEQVSEVFVTSLDFWIRHLVKKVIYDFPDPDHIEIERLHLEGLQTIGKDWVSQIPSFHLGK